MGDTSAHSILADKTVLAFGARLYHRLAKARRALQQGDIHDTSHLLHTLEHDISHYQNSLKTIIYPNMLSLAQSLEHVLTTAWHNFKDDVYRAVSLQADALYTILSLRPSSYPRTGASWEDGQQDPSRLAA